MKQYIKALSTISAIFVFVFAVLLGIRYYVANHIDWRIPVQKHILFMGASHPEAAIDDSLLPEALNVACASERYMYTFIKLQRYYAENPQMDTIYLQCSSTDLSQNSDWKYFDPINQSFFVRYYWPMYSKGQWALFAKQTSQVLGIISSTALTKESFSPKKYLAQLGGFKKEVSPMPIYNPYIDTLRVKEMDKLDEYGWHGNEINIRYLHRIVDFCKANNIYLCLVAYPLYKPECSYDLDYCDSIRKKEFADVPYLDFTSWPASFDERKDAHHLNYKGAQRFTKEFRRFLTPQ